MDQNPNTPQQPTPMIQPPTPTPAPAPQQPAPLPPNPDNKKSKIAIIIIAAVVLLIGLSVAGFFTYKALTNSSDDVKVETKSDDSTQKKEAKQDKKKVVTTPCLTDADMDKFRKDTTARASYSANDYFFEENSADFSYPDVSRTDSESLAAFVKDNKSKRFTLQLQGSVYRDYNTDEGNALSQKRAEAVKSSLVAAGVPADKIEIAAPQTFEYGQTEREGGDNAAYQNTSVTIKSDISCRY